MSCSKPQRACAQFRVTIGVQCSREPVPRRASPFLRVGLSLGSRACAVWTGSAGLLALRILPRLDHMQTRRHLYPQSRVPGSPLFHLGSTLQAVMSAGPSSPLGALILLAPSDSMTCPGCSDRPHTPPPNLGPVFGKFGLGYHRAQGPCPQFPPCVRLFLVRKHENVLWMARDNWKCPP